MSEIIFRKVSPDDAEELLDIYAPYIEKTAITFEYTVPSAAEFRGRIEHTLKKYPYIKAVIDGRTAGYAYLGAFNEREAYDHSAETTIYLDMEERGHGLGTRLYTVLENIAGEQHILNLNACIGYPKDENDEFLSVASPEFHKFMGYKTVGRFDSCGYKFGRWYDMIWMEKIIGEHTAKPEAVIPFPELGSEALERAGLTL
ncbi:MAG: GNAT family N-acetyltransferase [Anaerovoracaceae bacterium]|jgi:L-amino acid N-acyltransferase YncA